MAMTMLNYFAVRRGVFTLYALDERFPWALSEKWFLPYGMVSFLLLSIPGAYIFLRERCHIRTFAWAAWICQLSLNFIWPATFFYLPFPIIAPTLITLLFLTLIVLMFYTFLLKRLMVLPILPFFFLVTYKLAYHWVVYILNIRPL